MALLTNEETIKDLDSRLKEYMQFGMLFDYMLETNKIDISDLEKMFFATDTGMASISYSKILKMMNIDDEQNAFLVYRNLYPNNNELDMNSYMKYLNKCCLNDIINRIVNDNKSTIDKTYFNTYNYLLNTQNGNYARK